MNGYELDDRWHYWAFDNPDKVKPYHGSLWAFICWQCNKLGWKENFGLPTSLSQEATGITNPKTYKKAFDDLVEWGFINLIKESKNQHNSRVIAIVKSTIAGTKADTKADTKALDIALYNQQPKQGISSVVIDKLQTIKPLNNKTNKPNSSQKAVTHTAEEKPLENKKKSIKNKKFTKEDFIKKLQEENAEEPFLTDWINYRISQKAAFSESALNGFLNECNKHNFSINEAVKICAQRSWKGFKVSWVNNSSNGNNNLTTLEDDNR